MKKLSFLILLAFVGIAVNAQVVADSVSYEPSYTNDVYYSFANGEVASVQRATWDIAFNSSSMSASILTNAGAGVELFMHPTADTNAWATLDTAGLSGWTAIYNSDTTWEEGAFTMLATGHPDYGWGQYNSVDHNVYGHKLFVLKLGDGSFKKIWIKKKLSLAGFYVFAYDNLDNSDPQVYTLDLSQYSEYNFAHFSFASNDVVSFEPVAASWDVVFSRYWDHDIPYMVTGVLTNYEVMVAKAYPVAPEFVDYQTLDFSTEIKTIGSDWKSFNMGTFTYDIADSTAYFIQKTDGSVYKLVFTGFSGSSTGNVYFDVTELVAAGVEFPVETVSNLVFPNPVQDVLNIQLSESSSKMQVNIFNVLGCTVYSRSFTNTIAGEVLSISNLNLKNGMYIVELNDGQSKDQQRIIIK